MQRCMHYDKQKLLLVKNFIPKLEKGNFYTWIVNLWWQFFHGKLKMKQILEH